MPTTKKIQFYIRIESFCHFYMLIITILKFFKMVFPSNTNFAECLHNMTVHRQSQTSLYIAPFLKHSNRQSYRIHAYLPKIYRKIINITKSDFSGNFKNFQTKFSNSTWSLKILIHTHFPVEILSGSLKPTFPEFQLT